MDFGREKQRSAEFLAIVPPVEWQRTVLCVRICMCKLCYIVNAELSPKVVDQCHLVS